MDKMKRVFSFLLAFVITLGAFSSFGYVALADEAEEVKPVEEVATEFLDKVPADVKGTDYEKAVRRLVAFGIIEGFPDGTFKPENELTRAEFSKMVVIALGLEDAAKAMENKKTEFGDIYNGHWAQGYINVASSQGLIKGYEDGTFRPSNQVTYAEAVTILVRALGYQDSFLYGKWPANYISKAADLGISGPVEIPNYDNNAIRGNVARLLEETLGKETIHVVQYEGTAITYEPSGKLLREEKLGINSDEGRLVGDMYVDKALKANEVRVYKGDDKNAKVVDMGNAAGDYREFIGEKVTMFTKGKKVLLVENDKDVNAEFDFVKDAYTQRKGEGVTVELAGHDGKFELADDAYFYVMEGDTYQKYNGKDKIEEKLAKSLPGRVGKVVVEDGEIVYGEIMSDKLVAKDFMVVKEVKEDAIVGISPSRGDQKIDISEKGLYKAVHVFDQNGKKLEVKDIEAGDVVYAQKQYFGKQDSLFIVAVQDNNVTGELGRTKADSFEIDGEYQNLAAYKEGKDDKLVGKLSLDLLESSDDYTAKKAAELHKEDVIAYRGAGNLVVMLAANDEGAGTKFGVVTRIDQRDGRIHIFTTLDGKKHETIRFNVEDEDDLYSGTLKVVGLDGVVNRKGEVSHIITNGEDENALVGQPVKFRVNNDDEIAKGSLTFLATDAKKEKNEAKFLKDSMFSEELGSQKVAANAKVLELWNLDINELDDDGKIDERDIRKKTDDFVIYDYEGIAMTETVGEATIDLGTFVRRNGEVEGIVLFGTGVDKLVEIRDSEEAIFITDLGRRGKDVDAKYISYQSGEQTDEGTNLRDQDAEEEKAYVATVNRRGRVTLVKDEDLANSEYNRDVYRNAIVEKVTDRDNLEVKVNGEPKDIKIARSALVFDTTGRDGYKEVNLDALKAGDKVDLIVVKGDTPVAEMVVKTDKKGETSDKVDVNDKDVYKVISVDGKEGERTAVLEDLEGNLSHDVKISNSAYNQLEKLIGEYVTLKLKRDKTEVISVTENNEKAYEQVVEAKGIDKAHADAITGISGDSKSEDYVEAIELIDSLVVSELEAVEFGVNKEVQVADDSIKSVYELDGDIKESLKVTVYTKSDDSTITKEDSVGHTKVSVEEPKAKYETNGKGITFAHILLTVDNAEFIVAEDAKGNMIYAAIPTDA